jgi:uncharacterized protein (TIGR01777 family)
MNVLVTGATGLVGQRLLPHLQQLGFHARRVTRNPQGPDDVEWRPDEQLIDAAAFAAADAVVHLAGESIAEGRWSDAKKTRIRESRVTSTSLLADTLSRLERRPRVLVSASAVGYYGDRGETRLTEESKSGEGFLPEVCRQWEDATQPAAEAGIRIVLLRIGVVLSKDGGALKKMLLPFKLGAGGRVGDGRQYWSWIALADLVRLIGHALRHDSLTGPVNAVAPNPVTNREFTKTLGKVLGRPTILPMPGFMAKLMLGQMAQDLLLASARVIPERLTQAGFAFEYPELEPALRYELLERQT